MLNFIAIHPAGLGDAIEDLVLFKAILKSNENLNIHYLGNHFSTELADLSNISNLKIYPINKKTIVNAKTILNPKNIIEILRCPKYADLAYVFPGMNLKKTALLKYFLKPKKYVGALLDYPTPNLRHIIPRQNYYDKIHYSMEGYHRLQMNKYYLSNYLEVGRIDFNIFNYEKIFLIDSVDFPDLSNNYMIIHIGSSEQFPLKSLSIDNWGKLINGIIENYSFDIIFIGGVIEEKIINNIISGINKSKEKVKNLAGKTSIKQLIKLIIQSEIVISSDSGPGQIAGILGKKQIMLFGPTSHMLGSPINANCIKIMKGYECSPCYGSENYYNCPYNNKCMDDISIDTILKSISLIDDQGFDSVKTNDDFVIRCSEYQF